MREVETENFKMWILLNISFDSKKRNFTYVAHSRPMKLILRGKTFHTMETHFRFLLSTVKRWDFLDVFSAFLVSLSTAVSFLIKAEKYHKTRRELKTLRIFLFNHSVILQIKKYINTSTVSSYRQASKDRRKEKKERTLARSWKLKRSECISEIDSDKWTVLWDYHVSSCSGEKKLKQAKEEEKVNSLVCVITVSCDNFAAIFCVQFLVVSPSFKDWRMPNNKNKQKVWNSFISAIKKQLPLFLARFRQIENKGNARKNAIKRQEKEEFWLGNSLEIRDDL